MPLEAATQFPRARLLGNSVNKELGCALTLLVDYQDGTVSVSNRRIGDTAYQGPAYSAEPPAHRYQVDAELLGQNYYLLVGSTYSVDQNT